MPAAFRFETPPQPLSGVTGAIGRVCTELLVGPVGRLIPIANDLTELESLRDRLQPRAQSPLVAGTTMDVLSQAQLVLPVTSALHAVIQPQDLRPGSVICDAARPRDASAMVARARDDILVNDGGMVNVPGPVDFHFNFGFPPGKAYAYMAETMTLALEGRFEDYTVGKEISLERVKEIATLAFRHGFRLGGFRSFERELTRTQIEKVRRQADPAARSGAGISGRSQEAKWAKPAY